MNRQGRAAFLFFIFALCAPSGEVLRAAALPPLFSVTVSGQAVPLHDFPQGSLGIFVLPQGSQIHVRTDFEIFHVDVRPASAVLQTSSDADLHGLAFTLSSATRVTVEFNRYTEHVLHLFASAPELHPIAGPAPGVRYFGPGEHQAGLIELSTGETVYLAAGAWVHGRIRSRNTRGITIAGTGVLDGSGLEIPDTALGPEGMIFLDHAEGARIEGITIFNSSVWTVHLQGSDGARVNGVRILNPADRNGNDGFDVDSSSDVELRNIFVRTGDDCVAIKNLLDRPMQHIRVSRAVLWDMVNGGNGVEIGYELRTQPVRDIVFSDIDMMHVEHGAALGIHNGDRAPVEDVTFSGIRIEDAHRKLIDFEVFYTAWSKDRPPVDWPETIRRMDRGGARDGRLLESPEQHRDHADARGYIRNITVQNVSVTGGAMPYSVMSGFDPAHPVSGVRLSGATYLGREITSGQQLQLFRENADAPAFVVTSAGDAR